MPVEGAVRRLAGKVALITGGATGIGRATVELFAREGARPVIADLNRDEGEAAVAEATAAGVEALFVEVDVRSDDQVRAAVRAVSERFGRLDILVNSAGILRGAYQSVEEMDLETWSAVLEVNTTGSFLCCKHAAPLIERSGGGVILLIASVAGVRGASSSLAYGASKGGVQGLAYTLTGQLEPRGIRVNVVCPGSLDTPLKRQNVRDGAAARGEDPDAVLARTQLGDPVGVARVLTFLASSDGDYVRGTVFTA